MTTEQYFDLSKLTDTTVILICVGIVLLTALISGIVVYAIYHRRITDLRERNATLQTTIDMERAHASEKISNVEKNQEQVMETFSALSSQALKHNSEEFLKLAQENLKQFQIQAQSHLGEKEKAIETLVKPIKDALDKTEKQIHTIEQERKQAYGALTQHLQTMSQTQQALHGETQNLVKALSRPEVRGQWGELTLKRLAELAGMVEHCDFYEQEHTQTETGAMRPDMIVRMPGSREIVVDVKTPLDAYLRAIEATDDVTRSKELKHHTRNVRERVRELSQKAYWSQFKQAPDFVVLFIPGDQFLSSALEQDPQLLESAMQQKVILATPTSLVALLRAVAYGWRQESLAENAELIRQVGEDLYQRLATFSEHLAKVGKSLNQSVQHFNKAAGSFETRILPGSRKFTEMGISTKKTVDSPEQIESTTRAIDTQLEETSTNHSSTNEKVSLITPAAKSKPKKEVDPVLD